MKFPLDQNKTPEPTPIPTVEKVLIGSVETMEGSVISGWACLPGASVTSLEIYAGDFYGVKNLVATIQTGINNSSKTTVCSGNSTSGFSYQFTDADKNNYQGKDIHIKAVVSGKELWLYKPAAYVVPNL